MSATVRALEPTIVWNHFADLNAIPRPSKREERAAQFLVEFGKKLGLETIQDAFGNVIIRKPASAGKTKSSAMCRRDGSSRSPRMRG